METLPKKAKRKSKHECNNYGKKAKSVNEKAALNGSVESDFQVHQIANKLPRLPSLVPEKSSNINGKAMFEWMIQPVGNDFFFSNIFETKPLLVQRKGLECNEWISTKEIDEILREKVLHYGVNIDVTSYENGQRETHNQEGRAYAGPIWDFYQTGCSIRLLNPQTFCHKVWEKLSYLQEYVGNFCGANVYLTPPGTQGFAPHWDDIEAFVIQLEGCKRWRVYKPTTVLPDYSSHNLDPSNLPEPIIDCVLKAGDLLYFPRGYIHQGNALVDEHSLHITVSMFQKHAYSHLMSKALPNLLESVKRNSVISRESLPLEFLNVAGTGNIAKNDESLSQRRHEIIEKMQSFLREMVEQVPSIVDQSVDEFALKFMRESLPPCLSSGESDRTVATSGAKWNNESKSVTGVENIVNMDSQLRLIRRHCVRLLAEKANKTYRLYFSVENTRVYHEVDLKSIELDLTDAKNLKFLIKKYPKFCSANDLKFGSEEAKLELMMGLYEKGVLIAKANL